MRKELAAKRRRVKRSAGEQMVIDINAGSVWAEPRTLLLSYELHAFAPHHPPVAAFLQRWMDNSRTALERFFDPLSARGVRFWRGATASLLRE
ncbi:hypothetical protein [Sphingomonas sp. 22176]|uniref:hypothetical protein n=1 Tax=Sphingomonas sp. 22176 TaxID=3453884 RepID=UPI003F86069B